MKGHPINLAALHDVELSGLAATGDRKAFGELVRRHGSAVRALLRRMGADPAKADDIAQDAFIAAFERVGEFRGEGTFAAWVRKIAARLYLKKLPREKRLQSLEEMDEAEGDAGSEVRFAGRIDLDEALKTLGEGERLCVSLCYGAGLSHVEAADALKLPLGTVKSHVKRGLEKLRARLAPVAVATEERLGNG
ncbi:MAG TPA: sigma-70 family RNA polymerase sigma factor [Phenylobacterium sp.]|nr:sigma-70 family RNA polymerase sigma factor [Phenylobacterium sp.]